MNATELEAIRKALVRDEGWRNAPYRCTEGFLTIGVGENIEANSLPVDILERVLTAAPLTDAEIERILYRRIHQTTEDVEATFPAFQHLDSARKGVIVNMAFNLGITRLSHFKKMWRALESAVMTANRAGKADYYTKAAGEMLDSRWKNQVGVRAERLAAIMAGGGKNE